MNDEVLPTLSALQGIFRQIEAKMTKRNHKLLDYDRHRASLEKVRDKKDRDLGEERKLVKVLQLYLLPHQFSV